MKKVNISKILKNNKAFILAYDQGMEHGPVDFDEHNINPADIIKLANELKVTGFAVQKGIAEQYRDKIKVPLIIKLNGKTNMLKGEPVSKQLCSVKEALKLKASAVGYTIYFGSAREPEMMQEFAKIEEEAHSNGIPVILWAYPRGESIKNRNKDELMAYAARTALELGADMVKLSYTGNKEALKWAVKAAGKTKVVIAGGSKLTENSLYKEIREIMSTGICGIAIGRNIWQQKEQKKIGNKVKQMVVKNRVS